MSNRKPKYKIIDNFLDEEAFKKIEDIVIEKEYGKFPWYYSKVIGSNYEVDNFYFSYFIHTFYNNKTVQSSYITLLEPLFKKLKIKKLIRAKINLFYPTFELIKFDRHVDTTFPSEAAILYMNTCDGGTVLEEDTFIKSKRNRLLMFKGNISHQSTSCTNKKFRMLININYERN